MMVDMISSLLVRILWAESNQSVNALGLAQPVYYDQVALGGPPGPGRGPLPGPPVLNDRLPSSR